MGFYIVTRLLVNQHMRVVLAIYSLSAGGAERVLTNMANYWANKGWEITILTLAPTPPLYPLHEAVKHVAIYHLDVSKNFFQGFLNNLKRIKAIRQKIKTLQPNVIISFTTSINLLCILACLMTKVPVIVSERVHPKNSPFGTIWFFLRKIIYPKANQIVVQTQSGKDWFPKPLQKKISVIPNSICVNHTQQAIKQITLTNPCILSLGRLNRQKGFDLLINAFSTIYNQHDEWSLYIAGDGLLKQELTQKIETLNLTKKVHLLGLVNNTAALLNQADIFVLASRYEGFPNALCEAMASGCACIATDCLSGPREIIHHEHDGLLVEPENAEALANAMNRLIDNQVLRNQLAVNSKKILERLSMDKIMEQWESLIKGAVHGK